MGFEPRLSCKFNYTKTRVSSTNICTSNELNWEASSLIACSTVGLILFFKKWAIQGLFLHIFGLSKQTNDTILTTNLCEKMSCPSSIRRWDSNSQPLKHESSLITTRPGLILSWLYSSTEVDRGLIQFHTSFNVSARGQWIFLNVGTMKRKTKYVYFKARLGNRLDSNIWKLFAKKSTGLVFRSILNSKSCFE